MSKSNDVYDDDDDDDDKDYNDGDGYNAAQLLKANFICIYLKNCFRNTSVHSSGQLTFIHTNILLNLNQYLKAT